MHQRKLIICAFAAFISIFFVAIYIIRRGEYKEIKDAEWYVKNLNYHFCGKILKKESLSQKWGYGYIICELNPDKTVNTSVEDSLQNYLNDKGSMRFIISQKNRELKFLTQNVMNLEEGDSLCVDSYRNEIEFYRDNKLIATHSISLSLKTEWFN